ncbi:hypothetical protein [Dietzia sp. 179-F 9C3 NHS]|uniref:hypothetical protein n=1 Tax=Dietzia sp. 179-F 9C3 NHS TaxID=3374295 RepID=UPI0038797E99
MRVTEPDHPTLPGAVVGLVALAVGFGIIGMATGFATVLGITATASGGDDVAPYASMAAVAAFSLILGALLVAGGALLWRARRAALPVVGVAVTLLAVSSVARIALDEVTFVSVLGSVLSLAALVVMAMLLFSDTVREHVRAGRPLRLR